jgi:hypothetical protein
MPSENVKANGSQRSGNSGRQFWIILAVLFLMPLTAYWMFLSCDPLGVGFAHTAEYPFGKFIGGSSNKYETLDMNALQDELPIFALLNSKEVQLNNLTEAELLRQFPEEKDNPFKYHIDGVWLLYDKGQLTSVIFTEGSEFRIGSEKTQLPMSLQGIQKRFGPPMKTESHRNPVQWH